MRTPRTSALPAQFGRDQRGFTGAEKALLVCFGLAIVLVAGALLRAGSERAATDAKRTLATQSAPLSALGQTVQPMQAAEVAPRSGPGDKKQPALRGDQVEYSDRILVGGVEHEPVLFIDGPSADDVQQGALGDCWLLASLAAVAHTQPQAIRDMIQPNGDGTYTVTFYRDARGRFLFFNTGGNTETVRVNVSLPINRETGTLAYGQLGQVREGQAEIWVALVEKAYAQARGSYGAIEGDWPGRGMTAVTGWQSDSIGLARANRQEVIRRMREARDAGWPMVASTPATPADREGMIRLNVVANHAYTVIGVRDDGSVMLRNPWGFNHPGTRRPTDPPTWISYDDFVRHYSNLAINRIGQR